MGRRAVNAAKKAVIPITHFEDLNFKQTGRLPAGIFVSSYGEEEEQDIVHKSGMKRGGSGIKAWCDHRLPYPPPSPTNTEKDGVLLNICWYLDLNYQSPVRD